MKSIAFSFITRHLLRVFVVPTITLGAILSASAGQLHDAIRANDLATVESLLAGGADVDETDFLLGTALHVAVSEGNTRLARALIAHDADLEAVSEQEGSRALHLAAQFGDAAMVALLLDAGANIEAPDAHQRTPLLRAASAGHADAVRLMLGRGADVHARGGRFGWTSLHVSAHHGHPEVVALLLEHGADLEATDNSGETAFRLAATPPSYSNVGGPFLLEYLLAHGADPYTKDTAGLTALANAASEDRGNRTFKKIELELRRLGITR